MEPADYASVLEAIGGSWQVLTPRQRWRALDAWRAVFAAPLHRATGRWKLHQFEWHVFSYKYSRALAGAKALVEYRQQTSQRLYIVPEDESYEAGIVTASKLPEFSGLFADVYLWPPSLEWTMAFTHEEDSDVGPYFSRREWVL